jgi:hypothetical protein
VGVRQPAMKQQPFNPEQKIKGVTQTQPEKKEKKNTKPVSFIRFNATQEVP